MAAHISNFFRFYTAAAIVRLASIFQSGKERAHDRTIGPLALFYLTAQNEERIREYVRGTFEQASWETWTTTLVAPRRSPCRFAVRS